MGRLAPRARQAAACAALASLAALSSCAPRDRPEVLVLAAASTRDVLAALERPFEEAEGVDLVIDFGGSGDLARQLLAGRRADVFLSADERELDRVAAGGLVVEGARRDLLTNTLAVIVPAGGAGPGDAPFDPAWLVGPNVRRLALADPLVVPAGRYAKAWLEGLGLWGDVEPRVVPAVDVRAALAAVEAGAVDAGVVYRTDAAGSTRARVVFEVPEAEAPPVRYPVALLRSGAAPEAARAWLDHLGSDTARAVFAAHGFGIASASPAAPPPRPAAKRNSDLWRVLRTTLQVAGAAGLLAAPLGVALGYLLARRAFRGKALVETTIALPLVLPPTAIGYLLLAALAEDGPLGPRALGFDLRLVFTWKAAALASAVVAVPLVARTARAAFEGVDPRLELLARSFGCSRLRTFASVTLPLAGRGLAAAAALGFARALGEFGATIIVAGNIPGRTQTLALAIFSEIQLGHTREALRLVAVTVLLAFGLLFGIERLLRPARPRVEGTERSTGR